MSEKFETLEFEVIKCRVIKEINEAYFNNKVLEDDDIIGDLIEIFGVLKFDFLYRDETRAEKVFYNMEYLDDERLSVAKHTSKYSVIKDGRFALLNNS